MPDKILFIGDIHGKTKWRELANEANKKFYKVVFLGDYVDSFYQSGVEQLDNFKQIIAFLRKKGGIALLGNHDYAYIHSFSNISGYQHAIAHEYYKIFNDNIDLFNIAWGFTDKNGKYTLVTHAGLLQCYWNRHVLPLFEEGKFLYNLIGKEGLELDIHIILNYLKDKKDLIWKVGPMRGGSSIPGPLWADYDELVKDPFGGINQVFGHTMGVSSRFKMFDNNYLICLDEYSDKNDNKPASLILDLR